MENNDIYIDKEIYELYLKLYTYCIKYKKEINKDKFINCDYYKPSQFLNNIDYKYNNNNNL